METKSVVGVDYVIDQMSHHKKKEFMPTCFSKLDKLLDGGFVKQEMVVIGGGTGIGKSFLASQLVLNISNTGFKCLYLSLEISSFMLVARMIGSLSGVKPTRVLWGLLTKQEYKQKQEAEDRLELASDFIHLSDNLYDYQKIQNVIKVEKPEFVVVDFIQNVVLRGKNDEYDRLSFLAVAFQKLAKETNTCILLISQLSNRVVREGDTARYLEYKGAGTIAQVADLGFWLMPKEEEGQLGLVLRKNRRGPAGNEIPLKMVAPGGRIKQI